MATTNLIKGVNGALVPVNDTLRLTPTEIVAMLNNALLSPYTGADVEKLKMTKGEAAFMALAEQAQDGDVGAFSFLLDRLMGKPVQQVNALTLTANLSDFLSSLAGEMEKEVIDVKPEPLPWDD